MSLAVINSLKRKIRIISIHRSYDEINDKNSMEKFNAFKSVYHESKIQYQTIQQYD